MPESTQNVRFLATRPGRALHLVTTEKTPDRVAYYALCGWVRTDPRSRAVGPQDADWAKYSAGGLCTKCATALDGLRLAARVAVRANTTAQKKATK